VPMHTEDDASDRALVAAAQADDGEAFLRLVARYRARLEAFVRRAVRDPARAADLAQDALDAAYDNLAHLRDPAHCLTNNLLEGIVVAS